MRATISRIGFAVLAAMFIGLGCSDPEVVYPPEVTPYRAGDTLRSPTSDLTLTANGGRPYLITEDFVIPQGVTVTVEPGAEIMVAGLNWIDVQGVIHAEGNSQNPIIFTSANSVPDLGQWRGIKLRNESDPSVFHYCVFTYGAFFDTDTLTSRGRDAQNFKGMLAVFNSSPEIVHCVVTQNQNNAVYIKGENARPVIRYNVFTRNDASGVRADSSVFPVNLDISYNCVADNSAPGFILSNDNRIDSLGIRRVFGDPVTVNANLDSCDSHFNIDLEPLFVDPAEDALTEFADYSLQSCSPCVDTGPNDIDHDADGTRADMGARPYTQSAGELRGRLETNLEGVTYRMSCDVVIPPGVTVTVAPGARIEATGLFRFEVYGRLLVQGTAGEPVEMCACQVANQDLMSGMVFYERGDQPSILQNFIVRDYSDIVVGKAGVRFENCLFTDGFQRGIGIETGAMSSDSAVVFDECTFQNAGRAAVEIFLSSARIENCRINGSRGEGIHLEFVGNSVEVYNTVVEACSVSAVYMEWFCSPRMINNTIVNSGYHGIHMVNNCSPVLFNNIVANSGQYGIYAQESSAPNVNYNDVWNNGLRNSSPANYSPASLEQLGENISLDPQFSDGFYRLSGSSPCKDAGNPDSDYNDPDGSSNDIGAWGGPGAGSVGRGLRQRLLAQR